MASLKTIEVELLIKIIKEEKVFCTDLLSKLGVNKSWNNYLYIFNIVKNYNLENYIKSDPNWDFYTECAEVSKQFKYLKDFRLTYSGLYKTALKEKWIDSFTWLLKLVNGNQFENPDRDSFNLNYWNDEKCIEEAKKYNTLKEFREKAAGAYNYSREHNLLSSFTWLKSFVLDKTKSIWSVYVYEIDNKYVYIGLTYDLHRRDLEHRRVKTKDSLANFISNNNLILPEYILIKDNLTGDEAQILEDTIKNKYLLENKLEVINKAKTGLNSGSLGCSSQKWNYDSCLKTAKCYKTLKEFKHDFPRAYAVSRENGWIEEYTWLEYNVRDSHNIQGRKVILLDLEENELNTFDSITLAYEFLGKSSNNSNINEVCKGKRKTAYGYKWKYAD